MKSILKWKEGMTFEAASRQHDMTLTDPAKDMAEVVECVRLSMTKYCGVSAMVAPTASIFYTVVINGEIEVRDEALFPTEPAADT